MTTTKPNDTVPRRDFLILASAAIAATPLAVLATDAQGATVDPHREWNRKRLEHMTAYSDFESDSPAWIANEEEYFRYHTLISETPVATLDGFMVLVSFYIEITDHSSLVSGHPLPANIAAFLDANGFASDRWRDEA